MADKPPTDKGPIILPSDRAWFDPRLLSAASNVQNTDVTLPMGQPVLVAKPNPSRFAIYFTLKSGGVGYQVSPWPEVNDFPFLASNFTLSDFRLTLFEYPSLVQLGWYAFSAGGSTLRVTEALRIG